MKNANLYLLSNNNTYLLKEKKTYLVCLEDEDINKLGLLNLSFKDHGIVEENESITYRLLAAFVDTIPENTEYRQIAKDDLFNQPLRPGDKMFLAQMIDGKTGINLYTKYNDDRLMTAYDRKHINFFVAFYKHLHTVNTHRRLVRKGCFKVGLYRQGLLHDLSKYMPCEFFVGVKYYQGMRSPNVAERMTIGYSSAWLHHKGRNRHHQEYWTDYSIETGNILEFVPMPKKYLVESIMDRIAACKVYRGKNYNDSSALEYLTTRDSEGHMNIENYNEMVRIFTMLSEKGEKETFRYLKNEYLKNY